tara:strand:- start:38 stop:514 length:477 start_codon:yes stop_codon:yes gene_type:complete
MPKRPPDQVIEYRISLQDYERQMLDHMISIQAASLIPKISDSIGIEQITKMLDDPSKIIQVMYSIALILEAFGIESGWPTPFDWKDWKLEFEAAKKERQEKGVTGGAAGNYSLGALIYNILHPNWTWFEGGAASMTSAEREAEAAARAAAWGYGPQEP